MTTQAIFWKFGDRWRPFQALKKDVTIKSSEKANCYKPFVLVDSSAPHRMPVHMHMPTNDNSYTP